MTVRTIGDLLTKVRADEPPAPSNVAAFDRPVFPRIVSRSDTPAAERVRSEPPVSHAENTARLVDEAYERGKREGAAAAQADFDIKLAEQRTRHVMKLALDRHRAAAENAALIAERLIDSVKDLETEICRSVAAVLVPFVADTVRRRAVEDLAATLKVMVSEARPASLKVEGPGDLLAALKSALPDFPFPIEYTAMPALAYDPLGEEGHVDTVEVRARLDQRVIETQIGPWLERLRGTAP